MYKSSSLVCANYPFGYPYFTNSSKKAPYPIDKHNTRLRDGVLFMHFLILRSKTESMEILCSAQWDDKGKPFSHPRSDRRQGRRDQKHRTAYQNCIPVFAAPGGQGEADFANDHQNQQLGPIVECKHSTQVIRWSIAEQLQAECRCRQALEGSVGFDRMDQLAAVDHQPDEGCQCQQN